MGRLPSAKAWPDVDAAGRRVRAQVHARRAVVERVIIDLQRLWWWRNRERLSLDGGARQGGGLPTRPIDLLRSGRRRRTISEVAPRRAQPGPRPSSPSSRTKPVFLPSVTSPCKSSPCACPSSPPASRSSCTPAFSTATLCHSTSPPQPTSPTPTTRRRSPRSGSLLVGSMSAGVAASVDWWFARRSRTTSWGRRGGRGACEGRCACWAISVTRTWVSQPATPEGKFK